MNETFAGGTGHIASYSGNKNPAVMAAMAAILTAPSQDFALAKADFGQKVANIAFDLKSGGIELS